jgi:hypothetical protein
MSNPRRDPFLNDDDLLGQIDQLLDGSDPVGAGSSRADDAPERRTKRRPHEINRRDRAMSITFDSPAWPDAIRDQAAAWGLRPSDLVVYALSRLFHDIDAGTAHRPPGDHPRHYHRAGETLDLPWRPQ